MELYVKDGRKFTRVTNIINTVLRKPWLETWRGNLGNTEADKKRDEAAKIGTLIHKACNNPSLSYLETPENQAKVDAYFRWSELMVEEFIAREETIFNEKWGYAGTLDQRVILKGEKLETILDIKTGAQDDHFFRMQTAAYQNGDGVKAGRRLIVSLKELTKEGLPRIYSFDNHQQDFQAFLNCLSLYRFLQT